MGEKKDRVALVTRSMRIHPDMSRAMKEAGLNVSKLSRELLEAYVESVDIWKDEL